MIDNYTTMHKDQINSYESKQSLVYYWVRDFVTINYLKHLLNSFIDTKDWDVNFAVPEK